MSRRRKQISGSTKRRHLFHRRDLALPYATPPRSGAVTFDPSLHTAAELMHDRHHPAA
jgi:hypothetical protein